MENNVVDALSRRAQNEAFAELTALLFPIPTELADLKAAYAEEQTM